MASFKDLALRFVLTDDENEQRTIAQQAAREIEKPHAAPSLVGDWAASIQPWMSQNNDDEDDGEENIVARAKALGFLAATLEVLDRATLDTNHVDRLVTFFHATFRTDHKAGIAAATKALHQLSKMPSFLSGDGKFTISSICHIGEDFRLQTAQTRFAVYDLILDLLQNPAVVANLKPAIGDQPGVERTQYSFVKRLFQMCQHEKDPRNLMHWFKIIRILLTELPLPADIVQEAFHIFSAYFPISLRTPTTTNSQGESAITADGLKEALRACFAAVSTLAPLTIPYLLLKLGRQHDSSLTLSVKLDILRTLKACVEGYDKPVKIMSRHFGDILDSVKSQIRIGDALGEEQDIIEPTLDVLRAIVNRLDQCDMRGNGEAGASLRSILDVILGDCQVDIANPTYTKQMGLLAKAVVMTSPLTYVLKNRRLVEIICQNLRVPTSQQHTVDLLSLLNSVLRDRAELMERRRPEMRPADEFSLRGEPYEHLASLLASTYRPAVETIRRKWTAEQRDGTTNTPWSTEEKSILCEIYTGLGLLVRQQVIQSNGTTTLLCSADTCKDITLLMIPHLLQDMSPHRSDIPKKIATASSDNCLVEAFGILAASFPEGFSMLVERAMSAITGRRWVGASDASLTFLASLLGRLAFIGCGQIPLDVAINGFETERATYSPIQHFAVLQRALFQLFKAVPENRIRPKEATRHVVAGMHGSLIVFRDACVKKQDAESLGGVVAREATEFSFLALQPGQWVHSLLLGEPDKLRNYFGAADITGSCGGAWGQSLGISALMLKELYTSVSQDQLEPPILAQIGNFAGTVVQYLDEKSQISLDLAEAASISFRAWPGLPQPGSKALPGAEYLTLGVLEGLWPAAMQDLYKPGGLARRLILLPGHHQVRGAVGAILANKYREDDDAAGTSTSYVHKIIKAYSAFISSTVWATIGTGPSTAEFEAQFITAMRTVAGAAVRLHKAVLGLVPTLHSALKSRGVHGETVARHMGVLADIDYCPIEAESASEKGKMGIFRPANHTVTIKPLYKQWLYNSLVKPLYERAGPQATGGLANFTTAILSFVVRCPFGVWSDDLDAVVRAALLAIRERAGPEDQDFASLAKALEILKAIPEAEADDALGGHVAAVVEGATRAYFAANVGGDSRRPERKECRTRALELLGVIPTRIDHVRLVPYVPQMHQFLADACGGRSRELRQLALRAKDKWEEVTW